MKIDVCMRVLDLEERALPGINAVVFDVLRATSTILTALANGCRGVIPVAEVTDAITEANRRKEQGIPSLLGGERGGKKLEGFDAGNSPLEYCNKEVSGRILVLTTTNGTRTIRACDTALNIYIGGILNARAVARILYREKKDVILACAGTKGNFSLEDAAAAGLVVQNLMALAEKDSPGTKLGVSDAATAMARLAGSYGKNIGQCLYESIHGQRLLKLGFSQDLKWCGQVDKFTLVPHFDFSKELVIV